MFAALPQEGIAMGFEGFDNRELSWLKFNQRVLEEAHNLLKRTSTEQSR